MAEALPLPRNPPKRSRRDPNSGQIKLALCGDSHMIQLLQLDLFPPSYDVTRGSYNPLATGFHTQKHTQHVISQGPDGAVLIMGSNDIAFDEVKSTAKGISGSPPDTDQISEAIIEIAVEFHQSGVVVSIIPILPRRSTRQLITRVTPEDFLSMANTINRRVRRELKDLIGYDPLIRLDRHLTKNYAHLKDDGIHYTIKTSEYIKEAIMLHHHSVTQIHQRERDAPLMRLKERERQEEIDRKEYALERTLLSTRRLRETDSDTDTDKRNTSTRPKIRSSDRQYIITDATTTSEEDEDQPPSTSQGSTGATKPTQPSPKIAATDPQLSQLDQNQTQADQTTYKRNRTTSVEQRDVSTQTASLPVAFLEGMIQLFHRIEL